MGIYTVTLFLFGLGLSFLIKVCYNKWKQVDLEERMEEVERTTTQYNKLVNFKSENKNYNKKQKVVNDFLKGENDV